MARLTLNRPEVRNALNRALLAELEIALTELDDASVLIVTGAGSAFSAGADLRERQGLSAAQLSQHSAAIREVADHLAAFPVPVIAVLPGPALAGGAELALACDMRIASPTACLGFPEVHLGIFPGAGAPLRLPRLIGSGAARQLLFTGRRVGAAEALRLGLVQAVTDDPMALAEEWAGQIAAAAPLAVRALKRALDESAELETRDAVIQRHRDPLDATHDYAEGLAAFSEKRSPRFRGA